MAEASTRTRRETGPVAVDHTIDQRWSAYTLEEHARWGALTERMMGILPGRASEAFLKAAKTLKLSEGGIPNFERLSDKLKERTGWRIVGVPGLVPDEVFFDHLANRRFPAGCFIRDADEMDYIEEPDVFHDVFGHVPLLADPAYADFMEAYGKGGLRALNLGRLANLARLYWYTIEFGLIEEMGALRIFGAGIISSPKETVFALEDDSPNRIGFDLERVMRTNYRIDDFQQSYFVIDGFETLLEATLRDFGPLYERLKDGAAYKPQDVLPTDRVCHKGTQAYFTNKAG
ncbi:phenylalanine 4-monooxygenase [Pikeienuella piscinae]|uniref:Phenylalanine-4-hydroxylase n=1 Tax=Pikeienuella piscinae TaxID=2748098 RepID=A0A7L5C2J8_9RHOB|nr:phenylalanine 4-monooxygenase [Pikeienuella piscinae]QIE57067.1 phenylalanine 4-monooxygenase [Pikeienuella piscinae]